MTRTGSKILPALAALLALAACGERALPPNVTPPSRSAAHAPPAAPAEKPQPSQTRPS